MKIPFFLRKHHTVFTSIFTVTLLMIVVLLSAKLSAFFFEYRPSFPYHELLQNYSLPTWISAFAGFDGVHYLTIAERGYKSAGLIQAFFPVWPLTLSIGFQIGNTVLFGLLLNFILMVVLVYFLQKLVQAYYPNVKMHRFLLIFLIFPTSFFFFALYSETLFFLLIVGAFLAAHHKKWFLVCGLVMLASATRIVGIVLVPALLIELWSQSQPKPQLPKTLMASMRGFSFKNIFIFFKANLKEIFLICLGSLGLLSYMTYLQLTFGDAFLFKTVQSQWGHDRSDSLILYPQVVYRYLKIIFTSFEFTVGWWSVAQEMVVGLLAPFLPVFFIRKIRLSHLLFGFLVTIVPTLTGTFSSLPRYILIAFPMYISMSLFFEKRPRLFWIWIAISTAALILNTMLFVQGHWVA